MPDHPHDRPTHDPDHRNPMPGTQGPTPDDDASSLDRLGVLVHELRNLLDGCLRRVLIAQQDLASADGELGGASSLRRQLDITRETLEHMARLLGLSVRGSGVSLGSALLDQGVCVREAIHHAIDVLSPRADECGVTIESDIAHDAADSPIGPLYAVVLNALTNALDSAALAERPSTIRVAARNDNARLTISVEDRGIGIVAGVDPRELFRPGVTTRSNGQGLGLAVCDQIVRSIGGTINLTPRPGGEPGAILIIDTPVPQAPEHHTP